MGMIFLLKNQLIFVKIKSANKTIGGKIMADKASTIEKVKGIIANQLSVKPEEIKNDSNIAEELGADSLDLVELMMALEDELDTEIPDEEAENFKTVGDVVKYLKNHVEE